eukprot:symbB.v1.2.006632.t1/scaffold390.1/size254036/28
MKAVLFQFSLVFVAIHDVDASSAVGSRLRPTWQSGQGGSCRARQLRAQTFCAQVVMYALVRSRLTEDGLLVSDVEERTAFIGMGAGIGAAAGGMGAFMLCASKCPGGIGGSLGGMLGSMNPMNLMPFGSEKEEKDAGEEKDPEEKMQKQLSYIEKEICNMNCKMAGLMGAAAGGAAGHVAEKKLKEKSEAEAAAEQAPPPYQPYGKGKGKGYGKYGGGGYGYRPAPPYRQPPPPPSQYRSQRGPGSSYIELDFI